MTEHNTHDNEDRWKPGSLRRDIADVMDIVDRSGAVDVLDEVIVRRHPTTGKVIGRPRKIDTRAVLVGAIVNFLRDRKGDVTAICTTLNEFPPDVLSDLGVRFDVGNIPLHAVDHVWNRISGACDASEVVPGKRVAIDADGNRHNVRKVKEHDPKALGLPAPQKDSTPRALSSRGTVRDLDESERDERRHLLEVVTDRLLQATIPHELELSSWAVDWTDHEAYATTYRNAEPDNPGVASADPDARWGRRHPKNNRISGSPRAALPKDEVVAEPGKNELFYGYVVHLATTTKASWPSGQAPELAASIRVDPANDMASVPTQLVSMVDSMLSGNLPVDKVYVDRGYSGQDPEHWLVPLSDRGVFATFDLLERDFGRKGTYRGAILMGGECYCPALPEGLTNRRMPAPSSEASRPKFERYHNERANLDAYQFRRRGKLKPDLKMRVECPARAGRARCPLVPESMSISYEKDIPEITPPEGPAPDCCTTATMTVPREVGLGLRQQYPHGTKEWIMDYEERTAVERYNSSLKFQQRVQRMNIHVLGQARNALMLTFAAVSTNVRHLRNWQDREGFVPSTLAGGVVPEAEAA